MIRETWPQLHTPNTGKPMFPQTGRGRSFWGLMSHSKHRICLGHTSSRSMLLITKKAI